MKSQPVIMVKPFRIDLLEALVWKAADAAKAMDSSRTSIDVSIGGLYVSEANDCFVNRDCIHQFTPPMYFDNKIQKVFLIPCRFRHHEGDLKSGYSMRIDKADFYFPFSEEFWEAFTEEPIELDKFLGPRGRIKPRVIQNRKNFIKAIFGVNL